MSPGLVGINENSFINWLESSPQILSWIPTLYRMRAAEPVVHAAKCSFCKATPLLGLRYRCVKCSSYIQCQHCFLSAKTNHSHKLSHAMKEYCTEGNSKDFSNMLLKKLYKLLKCPKKLNPPHLTGNIAEVKVLSTNKDVLFAPTEVDTTYNIEPLSSPEVQLQVVIRQLELQNRELQQMVVFNNRNDKQMKKYLEEHRVHVATQIQKLKVLKDYLRTAKPSVINHPPTSKRLESTPLIPNGRTVREMGLDMLSPIPQLQETEQNSERNWNGDPSSTQPDFTNGDNSIPSYSVRDISTWIGGHQTSNANLFKHSMDSLDSGDSAHKTPLCDMQNDLDDVLVKLQQILANNFLLDETLVNSDNGQLKNAVTEMEGMLTSIIDGVESSRANIIQQESSL